MWQFDTYEDMNTNLSYKIKNKILKLRFQPIRVFCFHQVSAVFDASTMWSCDWTEIEQFKRNILKLKSKYEFISLSEAYEKLKNDIFRTKKYAVLTSDDGWSSLKEILSWLDEQQIPITLFLNPCYFDGEHFQERETEKLLLKEDIDYIAKSYPLVTLGIHGWTHADASKQSDVEFEQSIIKSIEVLSMYKNYIPYFAFAWNRRKQSNFVILNKYQLVPVLIRGNKNYTYKNTGYIDRELLDGKDL